MVGREKFIEVMESKARETVLDVFREEIKSEYNEVYSVSYVSGSKMRYRGKVSYDLGSGLVNIEEASLSLVELEDLVDLLKKWEGYEEECDRSESEKIKEKVFDGLSAIAKSFNKTS